MKKLTLSEDGKYVVEDTTIVSGAVDALVKTVTLSPIGGGQAVCVAGIGVATGVLLSALVFGSKRKKKGEYAWYDKLSGQNSVAAV